MELTMQTIEANEISTESALDIEGIFECYTLELPEELRWNEQLGTWQQGEPGYAIPAGRFPVILEPSPKFVAQMNDLSLPFGYRDFVSRYAQAMPHIVDIPGRDLIMFHWGNSVKNTKGCPLVGQTRGVNFIGSSQAAFAELYPKIKDEAAARNCFVTVSR